MFVSYPLIPSPAHLLALLSDSPRICLSSLSLLQSFPLPCNTLSVHPFVFFSKFLLTSIKFFQSPITFQGCNSLVGALRLNYYFQK